MVGDEESWSILLKQQEVVSESMGQRRTVVQ